MQQQLIFHNKPMTITLSAAAEQQAQQLSGPLIIEVQVYFSCLLGKRIAYYSTEQQSGVWQLDDAEFAALLPQAQKLSGAVYVRFNTVMTKSCSVSDYAGPPPVTDFEIKNQAAYVPSWLKLDFEDQQWQGEFGWNASRQGQNNTKQLRAAPTASRP